MSTPLRERPDAPLGTLIFRAGLLPADTIESALEEGVRTGKRLGEVLVDRGLLQESDLARLLAGQRSLRFVTLRDELVDAAAAALFSPEQARLFRSLPYTFEDGAPVVAVADPADEVLLRNIREAIGYREVRFVVATRSELAAFVAETYAGPDAPPSPEPPSAAARPEAGPIAPAPASEPAAEAPPELLRTAFPEPPPAHEPAAEAPPELLRTASPEPPPAHEPAVEAPPEPLRTASPEPPPADKPAVEAPPELLRSVSPAPPPAHEPPAPAPIPLQRVEAVPSPPASVTFDVALRLTTGERVGAGSFPDLAAAKRRAQELMAQVANADEGDWPFASGRFLKPDAIVSVDIAEHDGGAAAATGS